MHYSTWGRSWPPAPLCTWYHTTAAANLPAGVAAAHRAGGGGGVCAQVVPATVVTGYACDRQGKALVYRLNGLRVLFVVVLAFLGLVRHTGASSPYAVLLRCALRLTAHCPPLLSSYISRTRT
jgi:hypothetical protein